MSIIEIRDLKKHFGKVKALDGISFEVEAGEIFGFLGPNGAGKTTAIRCMMDFIRPTAGSISINSKDSRKEAVELKGNIGYLPGAVCLYDKWSGWDHIEFARRLSRRPDIADELIQRLDYDPATKPRHLSLGNRQKLGLILALMHRPELLLLDEPTLGLDPLLQDLVYGLLTEANANGATIFMSSHNLSEVERICHRVGIIKQGKMVALESIANLKQKRMYKVSVSFAGKFVKSALQMEGVQIIRESDNGLTMDVRGDINGLIRKLAGFRLKDLRIEHASLKDIFMEFYEK